MGVRVLPPPERLVDHLLGPAVRGGRVPAVGRALNVRVAVEVLKGVLEVDDINVGDEDARAHREEGRDELELLRRDLVRPLRTVLPQPARDAVGVAPLGEPRVEGNHEQVGDARLARRAHKHLELALDVGVADGDEHLPPLRHLAQRLAQLRHARRVRPPLAIRREGVARVDDEIELARDGGRRRLDGRAARRVVARVQHALPA
eukprot:7388886-Prymnesium_polylepis.2